MAKIELTGMDEIFKRLDQMNTKMANKIVKEALLKAGEFEAEEMKSEAPKRTGNMAKSIKVSKIKSKNGVKYIEISPDKDHYYYTFIELGTKNIPANPFMARSFAKNKDSIREIIKEELKKGLGL